MAVGAITSAIDSGYQNYNKYKTGKMSATQALASTAWDASLGAAFGAVGVDGTDALKISNKMASASRQAKQLLKTKALHPNVKSAAQATIAAERKYIVKTIKSTAADALASTAASNILSTVGGGFVAGIVH